MNTGVTKQKVKMQTNTDNYIKTEKNIIRIWYSLYTSGQDGSWKKSEDT